VDPRFEAIRAAFQAAKDAPPETWKDLLALQCLDQSLTEEVLRLLREYAKGEAALLEGFEPIGCDAGAASVGETGSIKSPRWQLLEKQGDRFSERYVIGEEIGRGGMGSVLRVHDRGLGRSLAMKVVRTDGNSPLPPTLAKDRVERLLDEARITGLLDHPGVVPVHELGVDATGRVYFTMRLVKGDTADVVFAAARDGDSEWTQRRALEVLLRVCETMSFAHQKGVLHRDLKPSNIMVGKFGEVYVMDWGLAKDVASRDRVHVRLHDEVGNSVGEYGKEDTHIEMGSPVVTMDGQPFGTPSYMPPEQARGDIMAMDHRVDIYAIGAILYQLLTGQAPYAQPNHDLTQIDIIRAIKSGPPRAVADIEPRVPAALAAICAKAMARQPEDRYDSVRSMAADLQSFLDLRGVSAYRRSWFASALLWVRRNRGVSIGIAIAIVASVVASALVFQQIRRAEAARIESAAKNAEAAQERDLRQRESARSLDVDRRREVADLAARILVVDDQLGALVDLGAVGDIEGQGPAGTVGGRLLRDLGADAAPRGAAGNPWRAWLKGRWAGLRGDPAATSDLKAAMPSEKDLVRTPGPAQLRMGMVRLALGDLHSELGEIEAGLRDHLAAVTAFRRAAEAVLMKDADIEKSGLADLLRAAARAAARGMLELDLEQEATWVGVRGTNILSEWRTVQKITERVERQRSELRILQAAECYRGGRRAEALKLLATDKADPFRELVARVHWAEDRWSEAMSAVGSVGVRRTDGQAAALLEAEYRIRTHDYDKALQGLERCFGSVSREAASLRTLWRADMLRAVCLLKLGDPANAEAELRFALRKLAVMGQLQPLRDACQVLVAVAMMQQGRHIAAMKEMAGASEWPSPEELRGWPNERLHAFAIAAEMALENAVAEGAWLCLQGSSGDPRVSRHAWLHSLLCARRRGASPTASLDRLAPERMADWSGIDPHVAAAELRLLMGEVQLAWQHLRAAGKAAVEWLRWPRDRVRGGEVASWLDSSRIEHVAASAIDVLADLLARGEVPSADDYWEVAEAMHSLRSREHLSDLGRRPRIGSGEASAERPQHAGWFTTIESLRRVQSVLPAHAAVVSFARGHRSTLALVATASTVDCVALRHEEVQAALAMPEGASRRERLGQAILDPLLATKGLGAKTAIRTLLFAPTEDLLAVPFEVCIVSMPGGNRTELIDRFDVGWVPGSSAVVALSSGPPARLPVGRRSSLCVAEGDHAMARSWARAALEPFHSEGDVEKAVAPEVRRLRQAAAAVQFGLDVPQEVLPAGARTWNALVLNLALAGRPTAPRQAFWRPAQVGSKEISACDALFLRDAGVTAHLALLHPASSVFAPAAEAVALRQHAAALLASGVASVVTASSSLGAEVGAPILRALASAMQDRRPGLVAWSAEFRAALGRGVPAQELVGLKLWVSRL
jgi:serine/threonine protein kinase